MAKKPSNQTIEQQNTDHTVQSGTQQTQQNFTTQQQPDIVINLVDLQNILVVFDLASNRGAFKGGELEAVGQLYNKIARFVQAATPPKPAEQQNNTMGG
jgi:hypothetical protein